MAMVKKSERHEGYKAMRKRGDDIGELADCSVIATALAGDISYDTSRAIYKGVGRESCGGVSFLQIDKALDVLSHVHKVQSRRYESEDMAPLYSKIRAKTLTFNNVAKILDKKKKYVIVGYEHMVAFTDGRIADWSEGTKHYVKDIYEMST